MPDFYKIIESATAAVASLPFALTMILLLSSFAAVFAAALAACLASPKARGADKRPFFHYLNLYAALIFIVTCAHVSLTAAVLPSALFWAAGYALYGLLCFVGRKQAFKPADEVREVIAPRPKPPERVARPEVPAARVNVRLEHALGITEKLIARDVGRSDRQELERIKSTLEMLHAKGSLTVQESDILNEYFNALLKLMARYNE